MKHKRLTISLSVLAGVIAISAGGFFIYVSDYYKADTYALAKLSSDDNITYFEKDGYHHFLPKEKTNDAFIFYPGGKVEAKAYSPLANELAHQGIYSIICPMTFNLAFFSLNAADSVIKDNPDMSFYIGGHSLGGVGASLYTYNHKDSIKGLALLASYSTKDLSSYNLKTISLIGSNDKVLKYSSYESIKDKLPNLTEITIEGGNHEQFGSYGHQKGDGTPTISKEEQALISATSIANWIKE